MLLGGPGQGHPGAGTYRVPQLPAHSPCQLSGWDSTTAKKNVTLATLWDDWPVFPPLSSREGWETLATTAQARPWQ